VCGIAGILTRRPDLDVKGPLTRMRAALAHRGPDDQGQVVVEAPGGWRVGLAHTRLSILDLSPAGHQPMTDPDTGSWLTFNGEIYNHQQVRKTLPDARYRSTSDTETLLKAWARDGERALTGCRGMFAFGLYDGRRRELWLVRDRVGVKPLYVGSASGDTWLFASEVRALLASGLVARRLNPRAVEAYLAFGAVPAPWTLLDGVVSLLPGERWRFDLSAAGPEPDRRRYWRPEFALPDGKKPSRAEAVEWLRPVLSEAASLRMVSDVPVGVFLSGGIDSSAIVALLTHAGHTPHTFSVVFGERDFDESDRSRLVARHFGTKHTELHLRPADVLAEFDTGLAAYDQPSIDGLNTYFISRATRGAGVKVALSGLGGDELFAGYPYFRMLARLHKGAARGAARVLHTCLALISPAGTRTTKLGRLLAAGSPLARYNACRLVTDATRRAALLETADDLLPPDVVAFLDDATCGLDPVNGQSLLELSLYLHNMLLRDTDQMSMAHALEVREPLLDHVLIETVAALPGPLKLAPGRTSRLKGLLTDALPAPLPAGILNRTKMGFVFPWERWLRLELRPRMGEVFGDDAALSAAGLRPAAARQVWEDFLARRPGVRSSDVLGLANLVQWVRRHGVEPRGLPPPGLDVGTTRTAT
jgi:asparagine synthase (glutamine-hydrolysing)